MHTYVYTHTLENFIITVFYVVGNHMECIGQIISYLRNNSSTSDEYIIISVVLAIVSLR